MATLRASTSVRLAPKEKAFIAKAASVVGNDLGEFIRNAARSRAEHVLESAAYQQFMEQTAKRAFEERNDGPSLTTAQVKRRLAQRRKK